MIAKYKTGDYVTFTFVDGYDNKTEMCGEIVIVDAKGTFFNPDEVCYDVRRDDGTWVKHVPQSMINN